MSIPTPTTPVIYPESDGLPMADNTLQFRWIQVLSANLDALFKAREDVFVGGNLFWYPVENFVNIVQAPDVFVVLGRPPGYRGSYRQWEEENIPMTVVFEIRSPNDSDALMASKLRFYDEHGVEEYYYYDPEPGRLEPYVRRGGDLGPVRLKGRRHTSQLLGIHFDLTGTEMVVNYPDGTPFRSLAELSQIHEEEARQRREAEARADLEARRATEEARQRCEAEARADLEARRATEEARQRREAEARADLEARRATEESRRANEATQRADEATQQADEATQRADEATQRVDEVANLAVRIRDLALKVTRGHASRAELVELEQLLDGG